MRNLFYNCFASRGCAEAWRDNVRHLCRYGDIFNHRKVVVIKVDDSAEDVDVVQEEFRPLGDVEFIVWPNDPVLHEKAGFIETLEMLRSDRPDEITFYAHTKGTGQPDRHPDHCTSIRQWRNRLYFESLSDPEKVDAVMEKYAACGRYLIRDHFINGLTMKWLFGGTFWWVNHQRLFSKPTWREIIDRRDGPEAYLSTLFELDEIFVLYDAAINWYFDIFKEGNCPGCGRVVVKNEETRCPQCGEPVEVTGVADMYY